MPPRPTKQVVTEIFDLFENKGLNKSQIANKLSIHRGTVREYLKLGLEESLKLSCEGNKKIPDLGKEYSYILGLYLGDGHITKMKNKKDLYRLRIFLDHKYQGIVEECKSSLESIFPDNTISVMIQKSNGIPSCDVVYMYSKNIITLFPQHGAGKKHNRTIELEDFQREILDKYPKEFLRGLIHSDGSRYKILKEKQYYGYNFTNCSLDIIGLFVEYCAKVGIPVRVRNKKLSPKGKTPCYTAEITRRQYVETLDEFIGQKI